MTSLRDYDTLVLFNIEISSFVNSHYNFLGYKKVFIDKSKCRLNARGDFYIG